MLRSFYGSLGVNQITNAGVAALAKALKTSMALTTIK